MICDFGGSYLPVSACLYLGGSQVKVPSPMLSGSLFAENTDLDPRSV